MLKIKALLKKPVFKLGLAVGLNLFLFGAYMAIDLVGTPIIKHAYAIGLQPPVTTTVESFLADTFDMLNTNIPFWWIPVLIFAIVKTAKYIYRQFTQAT